MKNIKNLYITLVQPIIENYQQAWCLHLQKHIEKLERVQRRATKMITGISKLPCYLRLRVCGLLSLRHRQQENIEAKPYSLSRKTQVNSRLDTRHKFFSQLIIKPWNTLPSDCVNALTANNLKTKYQNYCHNH